MIHKNMIGIQEMIECPRLARLAEAGMVEDFHHVVEAFGNHAKILEIQLIKLAESARKMNNPARAGELIKQVQDLRSEAKRVAEIRQQMQEAGA
jgi:hypothetical protein